MGGYLLSRFILFSIKYVRYLMASWCIFFMSVLISFLGILSLLKYLNDC
jgi:hypothetical protein